MRRSPRAVAMPLLLSLAVLGACGSDDEEGASGGGGGAEVEAGSPEEGTFPMRFEHMYGETVIEAEPVRVVAAGFNDADYVLAFDVEPLGVRDFIGDYDETARPWAAEALEGFDPAIVSDAAGALNFEAVAALEPDLIVAYSYLEESDYDTLSSIAPTLTEPAPGTLWPQHTLDVGRALGAGDEAEALVAEVEATFEEAAATHPEFDGAVMAIQFAVDPGQYYSLDAEDPRTGLFRSLGFEFPEVTGEVSAEQVELLDQELLVVLGADEATYADDALFQSLAAVQEGRVAYLGGFGDDFAGALGFDSPLSLPFAVDLAVPLLADALAAGG